MTTRSLLWWVALLGGAELALRGHLWDRPLPFHAGAWLAVGALAVAARRAAGSKRWLLLAAAGLPIALSALAAAGVPSPAPDPLALFWERHAADRQVLAQVAPGAAVTLFGTSVALTDHGFREQARGPDDAYRIVLIGGSSTFDAPRSAEEAPWPARLEEAIQALPCRAPVRVYNAGRTGRGIAAAVRGFREEIAPLEPDLLVVYPGPVDLFSLAREAPAEIGVVPPQEPRVSTLLLRLESGWRVRDVARRYRAVLAADPRDLDLDAIPLADVYRRLLLESRRRGIDVALATPGLAVNGASPEREIRRHEALEPRTRHAVLANRLHTRLVRGVGASFRAIPLDGGADLDGAGDACFIDLFHLTAAGRERLVHNLVLGLREKLAAQPRPGCAAPPESAARGRTSDREGGRAARPEGGA